ncbi:uncharacterized protein RSE6_12472 [Rhynchosporium secalis]|uniref:Uncharacterized protein n=1 Tax=Rhynchosporium secalis TaxID=38038 RepID=A0A1E1MQJ0_RHYSE|nr:uncharacterized protein RSE6_12472 [Rhynchosporium secalis]
MDSIHVVSKLDNNKHATFELPTSSQRRELKPSSILVRPALISLTSNNLSYARGGSMLHWWDAYPVPSSAPSPFNDAESWGIVPAWGYATVLQSNIAITQGSTVWGFWPTSTAPVQLELTSAGIEGHWIETSPHRQKLMTTYNRYIVQDTTVTDDVKAWSSLFQGVWQGAYFLNKYVFTADPAVEQIHPLGSGGAWTTEDADLKSAVVVSLSASSKTARSFAYHLASRQASAGPLALLQITAFSDLKSPASQFPIQTLDYSEVFDRSGTWTTHHSPSKIVVADFGARGNALAQLLESFKSTPSLASAKVVVLQIGSQQKVYTGDEMLAAREAMTNFGKIQYNTAGIQDTVMSRDGQKQYFDEQDKEWEKWLRGVQDNVGNMKIVWLKNVGGEASIEDAWERLCQGSVASDEGLVIKL